MPNIFRKIKSKISDKRRKINSKEDNTLKKEDNTLKKEENPDSLEQITEDFFKNPTKQNAIKASTSTVQLQFTQFKKYNPLLIGTMSAVFTCYVRPKAEISKLDFRKTLSAINALYTVIDLGSSSDIKNEHLNKFKQKGIEYFDHLSMNLGELVRNLDASQRENIVKSIEKGTYHGYAEKIGYTDAEYVLGKLEIFCAQNPLEKIMEDFFDNPTKDNAEKASTFTAQLMQFKRYNPQLIASMSAGFPYYVKPEAEISKLDFIETIAAIRTLYTIIDLGSSAGIKNEHLNKFKQKGIEYFDHLKSNLNDLVKKLDASQRENIVKSIDKKIYNGYAEKIGYPNDKTKYVLDELKRLCS